MSKTKLNKDETKKQSTQKPIESKLSTIESVFKISIFFAGFIFMILLSYNYATYVKSLHESYLWFTKIEEVEKEISFRTESGLYYSFYKELIHSENFIETIQSFINDNKTESWRTINVFERFNIYQEVILASIYKLVNFKDYKHIYFYIDSVFFLHGIYISALFSLTWFMSKSIFSPILTVAFYVVNRHHTTRVDYSIPLRESFALPFIYLQILFICIYLKTSNKNTLKKKLLEKLILITTLIFCSFWQFSPFILFLQSLAILSLYIIGIFSSNDAINLLYSNFFALISTSILHFLNKMILASFSLHFTYVAILIIYFEERYQLRKNLNKISEILYMIALMVTSLIITLFISFTIKSLLNIQSDNHIYKFIASKLGYDKFSTDFETRLYLCHGGFGYMQKETFLDLSKTYMFPIYSIGQLIYSLVIVINVFKSTKFQIDKDIAFFSVQTLIFGLLALSTSRMKYLWLPSVCVLTPVFLSDRVIFKKLFQKVKFDDFKIEILRSSILLLLITILYNKFMPIIKAELADEREFYDPNTVELMNWINQKTSLDSSFTGSMQLLAGVKCCTGHKITNHPHFENQELRYTTKQLYQIYALKHPSEVYSILKEYGTNYIILEDSICLAQKNKNMCGLVQLLDIDNGHLKQDGSQNIQDSNMKRFCDEIRYNKPPYTNYFKLVMQNPTFRVYELV